MSKKYDFVVFGATGFTGQFVVEEVAKVSKEGNNLEYAIAGRNADKLREVLRKAEENTKLDFSNVDIIVADVSDQSSLVAMARQAKVVINCVGPYRFHGMKVVEACLEGAANHVDISGEPQYLEKVQAKYFDEAKEKGLHIVGACGFDSVPADMGTVFLQNNFGGDVNSVDMVVGMHEESQGSAPVNVTTLECALYGYSARNELKDIRKELYKERIPKPKYRASKMGTVAWSEQANRWCLPNMASDRSVVMRTQNLNYRLEKRRPLQFDAYFGMDSLLVAIGGILFGLVFALMAPFQFTRNLMIKYPALFTFGTFSKGTARREQLKGMKFCITLIGTGWDNFLQTDEEHDQPPNVKKIAQVTGPDPGYFGTSAILVQCALTVLKENKNLPAGGGVFTPGSAFLKTTLIDRLNAHGIHFKMVEQN